MVGYAGSIVGFTSLGAVVFLTFDVMNFVLINCGVKTAYTVHAYFAGQDFMIIGITTVKVHV